jgi:serine/threonine protein kinase
MGVVYPLFPFHSACAVSFLLYPGGDDENLVHMTTMNEHFPCDFGRYRLCSRIAVGGMAELFKATITGMEGFEKIVAIKRILPHLTDQEELLRAFIGEAKLAAILSHPNIVQIYDFGCIEGGYFIAMEHLSGRDLSLIFLKGKEKGLPITLEHALYITSKICEGLDFAHNRKDNQGNPLSIIHRDISPPNVLITYEGEVKIVDFGVAKAAGMNTKTREGVIKGKVCYMSPEQASGCQIDHRSDLFSTGILLYEMVTGQRMFTGDPLHTLLRVREADFQPAENVAPGLPQDIYRILHRSLAKDPRLRYQSAAEMLFDMEDFLCRSSLRPSARTLSQYAKELFAGEIVSEGQALSETSQAPHSETRTLVAGEDKEPLKTVLMTAQETQRITQIPLIRPLLGVLLAFAIFLAGFFALSFTEESMFTLYHRVSATQDSLSPTASFASIPTTQIDEPSSIAVGHGAPASKPKPPELEWALKALKDRRFETAAGLFQNLWRQKPEWAEQIRTTYAESLEQWALSIKRAEPKKATEILEQALAIDPMRVRTRFELASLYTSSGRHEKAVKAYEQIAAKDPPVPEAVFNLAYLHATAKDYARAEALYVRLVDLAPPYLDEVLFNLALVQEKQGKKARCVENLQKAIAFNPSNESAKNYLARMRRGHS